MNNKRKNRRGLKWNMLTALEPAEDKREPSGEIVQHYSFECDCGNIKVIALKQVMKGKTKSCGCLGGIKVNINKENRYGKITITGEAISQKHINSGSSSRMVKCVCDCGVEKILNLQSLRTGVVTDCGCTHKSTFKLKVEKPIIQPPEDTCTEKWYPIPETDKYYISDQGRAYSMHYGRVMNKSRATENLNKIDKEKYRNAREVFYKNIILDFDSGKYKIYNINNHKGFNMVENMYLVPIECQSGWIGRLLSYMNSSKKNKKNVTPEYIYHLYKKQKGLSYFFKDELDVTFKNDLLSISVDRIDNSRGYEEGNINLVTRFENMGRNSNTFEDFKNMCDNLKLKFQN